MSVYFYCTLLVLFLLSIKAANQVSLDLIGCCQLLALIRAIALLYKLSWSLFVRDLRSLKKLISVFAHNKLRF